MRTLHTASENSTIDYDPSVPCLIDNRKDFFLSDDLKSYMNIGLELLIEMKKNHNRIGWIANMKLMPILPEEVAKWIAQDWIPRALEAGIQHIAMVVPEDVFTKMLFDELEKEIPLNESIAKNFLDIDTAKAWLKDALK